MTTERKLQVLINTDHVANLFENNGLWRLEYTDRWLNHADNYALAPSLPLQAEPIIDSGNGAGIVSVVSLQLLCG